MRIDPTTIRRMPLPVRGRAVPRMQGDTPEPPAEPAPLMQVRRFTTVFLEQVQDKSLRLIDRFYKRPSCWNRDTTPERERQEPAIFSRPCAVLESPNRRFYYVTANQKPDGRIRSIEVDVLEPSLMGLPYHSPSLWLGPWMMASHPEQPAYMRPLVFYDLDKNTSWSPKLPGHSSDVVINTNLSRLVDTMANRNAFKPPKTLSQWTRTLYHALTRKGEVVLF